LRARASERGEEEGGGSHHNTYRARSSLWARSARRAST
jgi:hypothetical protein